MTVVPQVTGVPISPPLPPTRLILDQSEPKTILRERVRTALIALPGYFSFNNPVSGINATDLFNLNTLLGAGIEIEVVRTLNRLRELWDPNDEWLGYRFERSSQAFPDVRLVRRDNDVPEIAFGIELKGWFLLAKELEPSLRYKVAPSACAPHDLICVVPWHLSDAVAGTAQVTEPWVESARYAAEYRDYWWEHIRKAQSAAGVTYPPNAHPYPNKADLVSAVPDRDGGGNFGRLPRSKPLMDDFLERTLREEVLGIPVRDWALFLRTHSDTADSATILKTLLQQLDTNQNPIGIDRAQRIMALVEELAGLII
ncbi:hypothetical protein QN355_06245 [Cryobacterium sp. 10S3]|uniref:hypothetical protein n=1 Tax=Cryobacterium sp. 10S3 TaxID=3048582 RepID=UPI002AC964A1|nr:hypothetical protein [Cryobacterium sp. 10S3]MEB0286148.1 hypothetical protein [Cryobacterium sp. 10S3]WPX12206.1 hypothetical protein RHM57_10985 [Cryobacterium sp. 10S3]